LHGFSAGAITTTITAATRLYRSYRLPGAGAEFAACASGTTVSAATCGTNCATGAAAGTYVTVSAQGSYTTIVPYPGIANNFTFTAASVVRIQ